MQFATASTSPGATRQPRQSSHDLTAIYRAADFMRLSQDWKITMFQTDPISHMPVDEPTVTVSAPRPEQVLATPQIPE